jgi:hypothetical protein
VRLFVKGAADKAKEKIKALYGVDIADKGVLQQIVDMAKSGFDGNLDMAIRSPRIRDCWSSMQKWEYKVFASHLDPAELVVLLDESGREGWELVTLVAVIDHLPREVIEPIAAAQALNAGEVAEMVPMQAFRYIFKRSLTAL